MKRLIITACVVMIAAVGMAGFGCTGGGGDIELSDALRAPDSSAGGEVAVESMDTGGSSAMPTGGAACDPLIITNTVIEVVGGDESRVDEPEGQTCLMSRVPDDVSVVVSVLRDAQDIVAAMQDAFPLSVDGVTDEELAKKKETLGDFMMPFSELGLEEVVGFAKFKYVDGVMEKPDDACRECMNQNLSACLPAARTVCDTYSPPPDDMDRCDWERVTEGSITPACDNWSDKCYDKCSEERPEPESIGILVRWNTDDQDADGTQKFAELKEFVDKINMDNLNRAIEKWKEECLDGSGVIKLDANGNPICDPEPTELKPDQKMEIEQIDTTVALVHSAAMRPNIIEPVRICNFIRFDGIQTRPPLYGELKDMRLLMKVKPGEAFTVETRDSRKLVAGIDLRDKHYRLYAGVVDKDTLATGAFLSSVINLGDQFGMELWKQMMMGLVKD